MKYIYLLISIAYCLPSFAQDTATVMFYNLLQFPNEKPERIEYLKEIVHEIKPDIFMVCELSNNSGSVTVLTQAMNTNGVGYYQRAAFYDDGSLNNMLYYNTRKFKLIAQDTVASKPRFATVYKLLHKGALENGDSLLYTFIVVHLKAGNTDELARGEAAMKIRRYVDNKTNGKNVFVAGDFNLYSPKEEAFQTFINKGKNKLNDPINEIGEWSNTEYYAPIHTQSTRTLSFGGGSTGGLDDRFDWILTTKDVIEGENGLEYVLGSYKAFGNDGKHFNLAINFKENTAVSAEIANALHEMSDHLPVVMKVANSSSNSIDAKGPQNVAIVKSSGVIKISAASGLQVVEIYDINGRLILERKIEKSVSNLEIALPNYQGIFLVKLNFADYSSTQRLFMH